MTESKNDEPRDFSEKTLPELREILAANQNGIARMKEIAEAAGDGTMDAMKNFDEEEFQETFIVQVAALETAEQLRKENDEIRRVAREQFGEIL